MLIEINDGFLSQLKLELECLKRADSLIDQLVPTEGNRAGMHSLLEGSIITLQTLIDAVEQAPKRKDTQICNS